MKYLGVDWGEKKIGLALGSSETGLALPSGIVDDFEHIEKLCRDEEIDVIVVGVARMRGGKWEVGDELRGFVERLRRIEGVRVELTDERLTTKMAGKLDRGLKGKDDAVAAQLILQGFLDSQLTKD